jgi:putative addiction module component (TIGR02574 family)
MINIKEILKLSTSERILMIEQIWDSIKPGDIDLNEAHKKELDKRLARYQNGETKFHSWEDIKEDLSPTRRSW